MHNPIIKKITNQKCTGYRFTKNQSISIITNTGIDKNGDTWQWTSELITDICTDGTYGPTRISAYGYIMIERELTMKKQQTVIINGKPVIIETDIPDVQPDWRKPEKTHEEIISERSKSSGIMDALGDIICAYWDFMYGRK